MNRAANSRNRAVIRMKLTVLSSLAAIQIELTIVMHWKSAGKRLPMVTVVARVTTVETIHSVSDSIGFKNRTREKEKKKRPMADNYGFVSTQLCARVTFTALPEIHTHSNTNERQRPKYKRQGANINTLFTYNHVTYVGAILYLMKWNLNENLFHLTKQQVIKTTNNAIVFFFYTLDVFCKFSGS